MFSTARSGPCARDLDSRAESDRINHNVGPRNEIDRCLMATTGAKTLAGSRRLSDSGLLCLTDNTCQMPSRFECPNIWANISSNWLCSDGHPSWLSMPQALSEALAEYATLRSILAQRSRLYSRRRVYHSRSYNTLSVDSRTYSGVRSPDSPGRGAGLTY